MKNKTQITPSDLLAERAPSAVQIRFAREVSRSLNPVDSYAGDREIRAAVAESFAARLNAEGRR